MGLMPAGSERFVELTHGKTRYFDKGDGPPVIMLHGSWYPDGGTYWYRNFEALSTKLRVLALDNLGFGTGDRLERHLAFPYFVDWVREFQDALGLEKTHLIGHTLGGWMAQVFAYESPQRVDRLVVIEDVGTNLQGPTSLKTMTPPTREEIRDRLIMQAGNNPLKDAELEAWIEACLENMAHADAERSFKVMADFMTSTEERQRYLTPRRWPHIHHEALFITSTGDPLSPVEASERAVATMPNARLVVFEGRHGLPTNEPELINNAILDFLAP
jgi:pimeloyl-ACP methyl ester carboxylesterase